MGEGFIGGSSWVVVYQNTDAKIIPGSLVGKQQGLYGGALYLLWPSN